MIKKLSAAQKTRMVQKNLAFIIYMANNEIIEYKSDELASSIEVKLEDDTVWLPQSQMVELFENTLW